MRKSFFLVMAMIFVPFQISAQPNQDCFPDKILGTKTVQGKLNTFFVEEVADCPSEALFTVNGKELRLVGDAGDLERWFTKKEGKKFNITYERVYGWLGDSCNQYERLKSVTPIK